MGLVLLQGTEVKQLTEQSACGEPGLIVEPADPGSLQVGLRLREEMCDLEGRLS